MATGYLVTLGNGALDAGDAISGGPVTFTSSYVIGTGSWVWSGVWAGNGQTYNNIYDTGMYFQATNGNVYFVPDTYTVSSINSATANTAPDFTPTVYGTSGNDSSLVGTNGDDIIRGGANNSTSGTGNDTVYAGGGNDTILSGDGNDLVFGESGNDSIASGSGDDVVYGDEVQAPDRVAFKWSQIADPDNGGNIDNGDSLSAGATQTVSGVNVTYTYTANPTGSTDGAGGSDTAPLFSTATTRVTGINDGSDTIDNNSSLLFGGDFATSQIEIAYSQAVNNVQFRVNDIDSAAAFDDSVTIRAYDALGNPIPVTLTFGSGLTGSDTDGVAGIDRVAATGTSYNGNNAEASLLVTIPGPVARFVVIYQDTKQAGDDGLVEVTDIFFDEPAQTAGNDNIDAGAGNDIVYGNDGNDTIQGGSGVDSLYGGNGNDTINDSGTEGDYIDGGAGNDSINSGAGNDTVFGGTGDDSIEGGAGNDSLYGGSGNDRISGGSGDDRIEGGTGQDTLTGGSGNDTVYGGADADSIGGGTGNDTLFGDEGDDILSGDGGNDSLYGGAGNDSLFGGDGTDNLFGGTGNDRLEGGAGADTLSGGTGNDTMFGGDGNDAITFAEGDSAFGGDGNDTFTLEDLGEAGTHPITIDGGAGPTSDWDVLVLGDKADLSTLVKTPDGTGSFFGTVTLDDGSILTFSEIEEIICFTPGTLIATPQGARDIAALRVGDMVVTRDHGLQPIRWIQARTVQATGKFAPIRIRPGVVTGQERDLLVSPQHRMLFQGYRAELLFGESEVLISAKHLIDGQSVTQDTGGLVTYIHMMFDEHEIVFAEGAATESFHPGDVGLNAITDAAREELFTLFPNLRSDVTQYGHTARRCLKKHEAALMHI